MNKIHNEGTKSRMEEQNKQWGKRKLEKMNQKTQFEGTEIKMRNRKLDGGEKPNGGTEKKMEERKQNEGTENKLKEQKTRWGN